MILIKLFAKLLLLPLILLVKTAGILLYGIMLLSARLAGPVITFFVICAAVSAFGRHWRDVIILAACCGAVWLLYAVAGFLIGMINLAGRRMTDLLRA